MPRAFDIVAGAAAAAAAVVPAAFPCAHILVRVCVGKRIRFIRVYYIVYEYKYAAAADVYEGRRGVADDGQRASAGTDIGVSLRIYMYI